MMVITVICISLISLQDADSTNTHSQKVEESHETRSLTTRLLSDGETVRSEAQERILTRRKSTIRELTQIIDEPENHVSKRDSVRIAIETLGEMRAVEAVNVLVEHIAFPLVSHPDSHSGAVPIGGGRNTLTRPIRYSALKEIYPSVKSLINIGAPCIPQVIEKLSRTQSGHERIACIAVLIELDNSSQVKNMLEQSLEKTTDEQAATRLREALSELGKNPVKAENEELDSSFPE